jgi:mannose-6-phosphate isomerase-like protein (cupin superfamily)
MKHSRRELWMALPALLVTGKLAGQRSNLPSEVYHFEDLPAHGEGGNSFRSILNGVAHSGCRMEVHESDLAPGAMPHPPHRHVHEEMFLIREGTLEITIGGRAARVGPGSAAFVASNEEHGIRNVGATHAQYFVLALGSDV